MTATGDHLDFFAAPHYRAVASGVAGLHERVQAAIRNRPDGLLVAGPVRELTLALGGRRYMVFYVRRGQSIGLTAVFEAEDVLGLAQRRDELVRLFGKGGRR